MENNIVVQGRPNYLWLLVTSKKMGPDTGLLGTYLLDVNSLSRKGKKVSLYMWSQVSTTGEMWTLRLSSYGYGFLSLNNKTVHEVKKWGSDLRGPVWNTRTRSKTSGWKSTSFEMKRRKLKRIFGPLIEGQQFGFKKKKAKKGFWTMRCERTMTSQK